MRTIIKVPKAVTKISPEAREIMRLTNLAKLGFNLDTEEIPAATLAMCEYFGMIREQKETEDKFKALAELLKKTRGI